MSSSSKEIIIRTINYNDSDNYNEDKFEDSTESDDVDPYEMPETLFKPESNLRFMGLTRKELLKKKTQILDLLPKLNSQQVRRYRLPFNEIIVIELEEQGYHQSAKIISELLQMEINIRNEAGPESFLWKQPTLNNSLDKLKALSITLKRAEKAHNKNDKYKEAKRLATRATAFAREKLWTWWWIAEYLFKKSIEVAAQYALDAHAMEAECRYRFGKFLLEQIHDTETARQHLHISRELSLGRNWKLYGDKMIFPEASVLNFKCLIIIAESIRIEDPRRAIRLCTQALRRAFEGNSTKSKVVGLMELALAYQAANEPNFALKVLERFNELTRKIGDWSSLCNGELEMAMCYMALNNLDRAEKHLNRFLKVAECHELLELKAAAHRFLGDFKLSTSHPKEATPHFIQSFSYYYRFLMEDQEKSNETRLELEHTRVMCAIAMSHEVLPGLIQLVLQCKGDFPFLVQNAIHRLIRWKDLHLPFWQEIIPFYGTASDCKLKSRDFFKEGKSLGDEGIEEEEEEEEQIYTVLH